MGSTKRNLLKFQTITNGDMSLSSLHSVVTNIQLLDNIGIQANFSGSSPIGTLAVEVSADYAQDTSGNVTNAGNWVTITSASTSVGSPVYFDLNQLSAPYIRLTYTKVSGTGTLNAFITGKML